uniref:S-arrestin n=1 Tax=Neolamprologus brichardi TaxID=32507 RepID=A0A3Q4GPM4_NEOBR
MQDRFSRGCAAGGVAGGAVCSWSCSHSYVTLVCFQVTVYMAKRDFVDHCDFVDPVACSWMCGFIPVFPCLLVYVMLSCTFRYGRQDMDVMGVAFRRDLFLVTRQVYPELQDKEKLTHTKIQQKLLRKLGNNAFPFFFEFPDNLPCSITLQPGLSDVGKKCAVEFEVKAFCGENQDEKIDKQSSVRLTIRKIQFSPEDSKLLPSAETTFEFLMSEKPLHVKLSLPKETFYHGEPLKANVEITNSSSRNIKDISLSVEQVTHVILYSNDKYVKSVAKEETSDSVPCGTSLKKDYTLHPLLAYNKDRRGLALDGRLKHEDTNLASSIFSCLSRTGSDLNCRDRRRSSLLTSPLCLCCSELDDMVFEEFKRAYLKGVVYGDDDESPTDA